MKNKIYLLLRIFVSFSLIAVLLWIMRGSLGQITHTLKNVNLIYVFYSFSIFFFAVIIMGVRLVKVLSVHVLKLSIKEGVYLCLLGYFFNNFLPTSIGGDIVKAYYVRKRCGRASVAFSGVFMDRLLAMLPFTFIPTLALLFVYKRIDNLTISLFVIIMFTLTLFMLLVILNKRVASLFKFFIKPLKSKEIYQKITRLYDAFNIYWHHKAVMIWNILLSFFTQGLYIISVFILAKSAGVNNVPIGVFFLLIPIISIIGMLPSINGLGVREASVVYMFKDYFPASTAVAVSILMLAMLLFVSLIGAFVYVFKKDLYSFTPSSDNGKISNGA